MLLANQIFLKKQNLLYQVKSGYLKKTKRFLIAPNLVFILSGNPPTLLASIFAYWTEKNGKNDTSHFSKMLCVRTQLMTTDSISQQYDRPSLWTHEHTDAFINIKRLLLILNVSSFLRSTLAARRQELSVLTHTRHSGPARTFLCSSELSYHVNVFLDSAKSDFL